MDPRESWAAKWIRVDQYLPVSFAWVIHLVDVFGRDGGSLQ